MRAIFIACMVGITLFAFSGSVSAFTESGDNNYFGTGAGTAGGGIHNSFFGANAGFFSGAYGEGANRNTFVGYNAGYNNISGFENTFLGMNAGYNITDGRQNTFIGEMAGFNSQTGHENTFVGHHAGVSNDGYFNTFIGGHVGANNTSGTRNTFIGYYSGFTNDTANENVFIGSFTGYKNTTGESNTFLGSYAGYTNTVGNSNTFIGYYSGYLNDSGKWNTFLGLNAGYNNTSGNWNTFIGEGAGFSNTTGYDNTFLGEGAGFSNQTGDMNVFLGFNAGYYETGSNRLYIENSTDSNPLIYGEFDTDKVIINGKLGVGASPTSQLTVAGVIESTVGGIKFPDGSSITSANTINADLLDGWHASAFAHSSHSHSGADITSGTVGEAYVDALIARDGEIMPTVLANDGSSSTLDADLLDGMDSTSFMSVSTDNWVNISGDTMTGDLTVMGIVDVDQDLYVVGNIYAESDARSKKDIQPIESSLNKIQNIQGIKYKWNSEENGTDDSHYGVIAQEVEQILPEIVKEGKNGKKKVAYIELIPVLIEAMKEQQEIYDIKFKNQQEIISKLLDKVEKLEREVKLNNSIAMSDIK